MKGRRKGWHASPARDGVKVCCRCFMEKPVSEYTRSKQGTDGLKPACKACRRADATTALQKPGVRARRNAASRRWYSKHIDQARAISRASRRKGYYADVEASRASGRAWANRFRLENREAWRAIKQRCERRRRAQKRGATTEPVNYERICARDRMTCHLCRKKVARKTLEFDHVIPLTKGGAHTESNIAVSHRTCNRQKFTKVLTLF